MRWNTIKFVFFTVNNQVIFLKCIFEFVFNTAQSALNGVAMLFFFHYFAVLFYLLICCSVVVFFLFIYFLLPVGFLSVIATSGPYPLLRKQSALLLGVVHIEVQTV